MQFVTDKNLLDFAPMSACVLYSAHGDIVHRHEVVNLSGAVKAEDSEIEASARRLAAQLGHDVSKLKAIHVAPAEYSSEKQYKVDTKSLRLIEVPAPPRAQPTAG